MKYENIYITAIEDCEENEGGYYCQIYSDEYLNNELGDFCIHKEELELVNSVEFWKMAFACNCYEKVEASLKEYYKTHKLNKRC